MASGRPWLVSWLDRINWPRYFCLYCTVSFDTSPGEMFSLFWQLHTVLESSGAALSRLQKWNLMMSPAWEQLIQNRVCITNWKYRVRQTWPLTWHEILSGCIGGTTASSCFYRSTNIRDWKSSFLLPRFPNLTEVQWQIFIFLCFMFRSTHTVTEFDPPKERWIKTQSLGDWLQPDRGQKGSNHLSALGLIRRN